MRLFGVPGLGTMRRLVTAALCGAAFWGGAEVQRALMVDRCLDAGGAVDARGLCRGLAR
jgi:hypothetical protein